MVDLNSTISYSYKSFRGLNTRDDENNLEIGQTPFAQNFEINRQTGLKKGSGHTALFDYYGDGANFKRIANYNDIFNRHTYLTLEYPTLYSVDVTNGFREQKANDFTNSGDPFFIQLDRGQMMIVDGANAPSLYDGSTVTKANWPPVYNAANKDVLDIAPGAQRPNPTSLGDDIGYPSFGVFFENRVWLMGDPLAPNRIYVSKVFDYTNFGNLASGNKWDVAFFVDIPIASPITGARVINDKFVAIYCEREIVVLSGKYPPAVGFPTPYFAFNPLNQGVGCLGPRLITDKGNNDHFFVSNEGTIYTLQSADNFQDIKPRGISSKIFPEFQALDNATFARGKLLNFRLRGELQVWIPSTNAKRYPDQCFVYDYSDSLSPDVEAAEWSINKSFGKNFVFRDTFIDNETNEQIILTPQKLLKANEGLSYDGEPIDLIYQLSTLDFDMPDNNKEIELITFYITNNSDVETDLTFYHLWDNGASSSTPVRVKPSPKAKFGTAKYNQDKFQSFTGKEFSKVEIQIANKSGKILKSRIRHRSEADIFIHDIIFRVKPLGK